jgi:hypothetical protein
VLGEHRGIRIDERLQRLADRDVALVKWTGWHLVLRARKP